MVQHKAGRQAARLQVRGDAPGARPAAEPVHAQGQQKIAAGLIPFAQKPFQRLQQRHHMGARQRHADGHLVRAVRRDGLRPGRVQVGYEHQRCRAACAGHLHQHRAVVKLLAFQLVKHQRIAFPQHAQRLRGALRRIGGIPAQAPEHVARAAVVEGRQKFAHEGASVSKRESAHGFDKRAPGSSLPGRQTALPAKKRGRAAAHPPEGPPARQMIPFSFALRIASLT